MGSSAGADGSNYVVIFRRVFFPASTVPKMYWEGGTTHPTTEFQERQTDNSSVRLREGLWCDFHMEKPEMSTTGGALMAARSVLSHSLKWVRCLLPHQGTHLPLQHPTQTPRCSSNPFLEQWLPVRMVQTRHGSFSLGTPKLLHTPMQYTARL